MPASQPPRAGPADLPSTAVWHSFILYIAGYTARQGSVHAKYLPLHPLYGSSSLAYARLVAVRFIMQRLVTFSYILMRRFVTLFFYLILMRRFVNLFFFFFNFNAAQKYILVNLSIL